MNPSDLSLVCHVIVLSVGTACSMVGVLWLAATMHELSMDICGNRGLSGIVAAATVLLGAVATFLGATHGER